MNAPPLVNRYLYCALKYISYTMIIFVVTTGSPTVKVELPATLRSRVARFVLHGLARLDRQNIGYGADERA